METLSEFLNRKRLLLILDNCEHLVEGTAELVTRLLQSCTGLRVLASSQERLGVPGESLWPVPGLDLPARGKERNLSLEELAEYEAVRLFVERATTAKSGFVLNEQNAAAVVQICRRLDGIPLAIELAAARVRLLSPRDILVRLEDRFRILTGGDRTRVPRQQALWATVNWSVDLLTESERLLFCRASVFSDGFDLDAAEAVCSGAGLEDFEVLHNLSRLVDKSLFLVREEPEGAVRYQVLETLREYGRVRLDESGDAADLRNRHADYYLERTEEAEPHLTGPDQARWLDRLEVDYENLRAGLGWFLTSRDPGRAIRMCAALWRFWFVRGLHTEGRALLARSLDLSPPEDPAAVSHRARTLYGAGVLAIDQGDYETARAQFEASLGLWREMGDRGGEAQTLNSLGIAARDQGDYETARSFLEKGLAIHREMQHPNGIAMSIHALGITAHREGDCDTSRRLFEEGLEIRRREGDRRGIAALLAHLGSVSFDEGKLEEARRLLSEGLTIFRELGNKRGMVWALLHLGGVALKQGDLDTARTHLAECLTLSRSLGDKHHIARSLERCGCLAVARGQTERGLQLIGAAEALREAIGSPREPLEAQAIDHDLATAGKELSPDRAGAALDAGKRLPVEEAISLALAG